MRDNQTAHTIYIDDATYKQFRKKVKDDGYTLWKVLEKLIEKYVNGEIVI